MMKMDVKFSEEDFVVNQEREQMVFDKIQVIMKEQFGRVKGNVVEKEVVMMEQFDKVKGNVVEKEMENEKDL
jgi:hypothetical protein